MTKKKFRIIALDIDGTLATSEKTFSERNVQVLEKAQQQGFKVALVSGRPMPGMAKARKALKLDQYGGLVLAFNGAKIHRCDDGKCLYENVLPKEYIARIQKISREVGACAITYSDGALYSESDSDKYLLIEARINSMPIVKVPDLAEATTFNTPKCLVVGEPDEMAKLEVRMRDEFPDLSVFRSEPYFLEILPKGVDKAFALEFLCKEHGITRDNIIAMGDGFNDISMIKYAGHGIAMKNANDAVKEAADFVCPYTNDEDGVAEMVEMFVFDEDDDSGK